MPNVFVMCVFASPCVSLCKGGRGSTQIWVKSCADFIKYLRVHSSVQLQLRRICQRENTPAVRTLAPRLTPANAVLRHLTLFSHQGSKGHYCIYLAVTQLANISQLQNNSRAINPAINTKGRWYSAARGRRGRGGSAVAEGKHEAEKKVIGKDPSDGIYVDFKCALVKQSSISFKHLLFTWPANEVTGTDAVLRSLHIPCCWKGAFHWYRQTL